jgi:multidrug resistance efflux pump
MLWIPIAAFVALALFPVRLQFTGEAKLLPQKRALSVAQVEGRIVEIYASAGDVLQAGQPVARLDDTELRKQYEIAAQEETRLKADADRLLSVNERTAAQVAQLAMQRARREKEFHENRLALATIRSPIEGVVMTPELRSRQGDAVQPGSQLALIGDPSSWELEIGLPETDVAAVLTQLHQGKEVPVRFKLAAIPQQTFDTTLRDPASVASSSEVVGGRNTFRIVLPLSSEPAYDALFRAGYTGRARLVMGYRPLSYNILRRFFNWTRTTLFF